MDIKRIIHSFHISTCIKDSSEDFSMVGQQPMQSWRSLHEGAGSRQTSLDLNQPGFDSLALLCVGFE